VNVWDVKSHKPLTGSYSLPTGCKVFAMALSEHRLVVASAGRHIFLYDMRQMTRPEQVRESSLLHQTRCVRCLPDGSGYALSSVEARVAVEYFDASAAVQKKKYAFKCHRRTSGKQQLLYPINALAFHPIHGTLATGGCDGVVNTWDIHNKKRIISYTTLNMGVAAMDFNRNGQLLAVAKSYTFEEGDKTHPPDAVLVRKVNDHEVRPKQTNLSSVFQG